MGRHRNYALGGQPAPEATDAMLQQQFSITSAELLALSSSPKTLVGAPGAQRVLVPIAIAFSLNFLTTPYLLGGSASLYTGPPANGYNWGVVLPDFFVQAAADTEEQQVGMPNAYRQAGSILVQNQPLILKAASDFTVGDSAITGVIFYGIAFLP